MDRIFILQYRSGLDTRNPSAPCHTRFPATPATASGPAIIILALAAFVIVSTEFLIVGLIPALARDFGVSVPQAGQLVALFAFTVMLAGRRSRPRWRTWNASACSSPSCWSRRRQCAGRAGAELARFIPALALPVFWARPARPPRMAGRCARARPCRASPGHLRRPAVRHPDRHAGGGRHRLARQLLGLAALSLLAALMARHMPALSQSARTPLRDQARILKDPLLLAHIGLSVAVFTAMFTAYTYLADILERLAGGASAGRLVADGLRRGRPDRQRVGRQGSGPASAARHAGLHAAGPGHAGQHAAGRKPGRLLPALAAWSTPTPRSIPSARCA